jgi:hypothetical protein
MRFDVIVILNNFSIEAFCTANSRKSVEMETRMQKFSGFEKPQAPYNFDTCQPVDIKMST